MLMRLLLPPLPRLPRPRWPRRELRAVLPRSEPGLVLRVFRSAALTTISFIITAADSAAFAESYRGLWLWARHHGLSGFWAAAFPLQVDTFIVVGELALFVAMIDQWKRRHKAGAWAVTLLGLAASVAGNIGHVAAHDLQSRGTAAVPPVAAFAAMWVGLFADTADVIPAVLDIELADQESVVVPAHGPIQQLDARTARITDEGVQEVAAHLRRFTGGGSLDAPEQGMLDRLASIASGGMKPTSYDLNFFTHELDEAGRYAQLGFGPESGVDLGSSEMYEVWNDAHTAALEDYGISDAGLFYPGPAS